MVEKRGKFAALADLNKPEVEFIEPEAPIVETNAAPAEAKDASVRQGSARGRPISGKRSNPEYRLSSHYLKRKTQRAAVTKLMAEDDGRDLSDVLQELLERWVKE